MTAKKRTPRAKSKRPAPRRNTHGTTYTVHTVDAVGNKRDGWEINDVNPSRDTVTLHGATVAEVFRALKDADLLTAASKANMMYVDDQGDQIYVHRKSDGKPIFELRSAALRNTSHRGKDTGRRGVLRNSARDGAEEAIKRHFQQFMPAAVKHQLTGANWDLYNGPLSKSDARAQGIRGWKGFTHATKVLDEWADQWLEPVWYNQEYGGVETSEPEGYEEEDGTWVEPEWGDYIKYDIGDVKAIMFGRELARTL